MITVLTSVSASPGVSTTATAWAYLSERPTVIVEADTTGGSPILAGLWRGTHPHDVSVLTLAQEAVEDWAHAITQIALPLPETDQRWLLPAISTPAQATPARSLWPDLGRALAELSDAGIDVVVDLGRFGRPQQPDSLLERCDATVVLTDTTLPAVATLRQHLPVLRERLAASGTARRLAIAPIVGDDERAAALRPFSQSDLSALTRLTDTPIVASIPRAVRDAAVYHYSAPKPRRHHQSRYVRSIGALIASTRTHAEQARDLLTTTEVSQ